jgi:hypothetical protein
VMSCGPKRHALEHSGWGIRLRLVLGYLHSRSNRGTERPTLSASVSSGGEALPAPTFLPLESDNSSPKTPGIGVTVEGLAVGPPPIP